MNMEARSSTADMIVPEVLTENNYKTWSVHMKSYLFYRNLWSTVSGEARPGSSSYMARQNNESLRAIQLSCGTEAFNAIFTTSTAKEAWEILMKLFSGYTFEDNEEAPTFQDSELLERRRTVRLIKAIRKGDVGCVAEIINSEAGLDLGARISKNGYTALHVAISTGQQRIVKCLIREMSQEQLEIRDRRQRTALYLAACHGKTETAPLLIEKHRGLLCMKDNEGNFPLLAACQGGHVEMTRLLWGELKTTLGNDNDGERNLLMNDVTSFLQACVKSKMLDIASEVLHALERQCIGGFGNHWIALLSLAEVPSAFFSGSRLVFWERWMYSVMRLPFENPFSEEMLFSSEHDEIVEGGMIIEDSEEPHRGMAQGSPAWENGPDHALSDVKYLISLLNRAMETSFRKMKSLILRLNPGKHTYELKLTHTHAFDILRRLCWALSTLEHNEMVQSGAVRAMFNAIKTGIVEFVTEIIETNPDIIWMREEGTSRDILMCAIVNRQEKIASFIYGLDEWRDATVNLDKDRSNLLHMAGKLAPDFQLSRISGAALQMQRELQWFKEVESIVPENYKECKNDYRKTPGQVFSEEHKDLQRKAEDWMKQTASSYTVVGALIITVMFAAGFTVPGGNNQETGFPLFLPGTLFKIFIISDAVSLSAASTSVLMFLGILTSRYAEQDFLMSLPRRLIIGLSTLFISIAMMMVAFSTALVIMLKGRLWIIIVMVVLSSIPISFFAFLQFPLLVEIFNSTYRWQVFKKKRC